ncbi:MAG: efflux transporter outer membrane subunit [Sphingomonadaceae bacterium]|nr:efflux transporter outer membrane subunit [Sphingomonadaceae bacterium]
MRFAPFTPLPLLALALSACAVGPDYERPQSAMAPDWVEPASLEPVDLAWWNSFHDPLLTSLVERAIATAPDVRVAQARLEEARANRDAVRGGRLPSATVTGAANETVLSKNGQLPIDKIPGFARDFSLFDIGFDASWELDFWGRQQRRKQGAEARTDAALEARRDVQIRLAAEVARAYTDMRTAQREATLRQQIADAQAGRAQLADQLFRAGDASRMEAEAATTVAANAARMVPEAQARADAAAYRIAALLGVPPEEILPELQQPSALPEPPVTIAAGVRSDLLSRRPDLRRAERELAAATADIGVAKADLYPRFALMGSAGSQAVNAGDLPSSDSFRLSLGPSISWPIFNGGRIRAQIRAADARADGALAAYEGTVTGALADSEAALNRHRRSQLALGQARRALASQRIAHDLSRQRFAAGEDSRLQYLAAQAQLAEVELATLQAQAAELQAAIALYKALGGGWRDEAGN